MQTKKISTKIENLHHEIENITEPNSEKVLFELLNLIEALASENEKQKQIIQKQRDEINKLKREQGKPNIRPNKKDDNDFSSEDERKEAEKSDKSHSKEGFRLSEPSLDKLKEQRIPIEILKSLDALKGKRYDSEAEFLKALEPLIGLEAVNRYRDLLVKYARYKKRNRKPKLPEIKINRVEIRKVDTSQLPHDAESKGHTSKVVQDVIIKTDNVRFEREVFWSPSQNKTYIADVPVGYEGDFGPHINSQIVSFKYVNNMSIPKIKEFYTNVGTKISGTYITTRLTKKMDVFHAEKSDLYEASLEACDYQQIDDTGSRVNGRNYYTHIVCNELCTVFFTTPKKDRLTILDILQNFDSRRFIFNDEIFDLLKQLKHF